MDKKRFYSKERNKSISKSLRKFFANETEEHRTHRIEKVRATWQKKMNLLRQIECQE